MKAVGAIQADIDPKSVEWKNQDGDKMYLSKLRFRCGGCGIGVTTVALPGTPVEALYNCRRCGHDTTVRTREPVMDFIDGIWEERGHMKKLATRTTNSTGAGEPLADHVPAVVEGKLVYERDKDYRLKELLTGKKKKPGEEEEGGEKEPSGEAEEKPSDDAEEKAGDADKPAGAGKKTVEKVPEGDK